MKAFLRYRHTRVPDFFQHIFASLTCIGSEGLGELFSPPFYAHWSADTPSSVREAVARVENEIETNGPYDGIFAHSEGGALALSAMLDPKKKISGLKFLLLANALPPFESSGYRRLDSSMTDGPQVHIPTVFITGQQDLFKPLVALTLSMIEPAKLSLVKWDGGHEVPNSAAKATWVEVAQEVKAILKG